MTGGVRTGRPRPARLSVPAGFGAFADGLRALLGGGVTPPPARAVPSSFREGSGRRSLWTVHRDIVRGSRYSGSDLRRLAGERGVGRPPSVLAVRRQEPEELAA
ncbi:MAG: hypothetical protein ACOC91_02025 [bacterium]